MKKCRYFFTIRPILIPQNAAKWYQNEWYRKKVPTVFIVIHQSGTGTIWSCQTLTTGTIGRWQTLAARTIRSCQTDELPMARQPGAPNGVRKRRRTSIWCLSPIGAKQGRTLLMVMKFQPVSSLFWR